MKMQLFLFINLMLNNNEYGLLAGKIRTLSL